MIRSTNDWRSAPCCIAGDATLLPEHARVHRRLKPGWSAGGLVRADRPPGAQPGRGGSTIWSHPVRIVEQVIDGRGVPQLGGPPLGAPPGRDGLTLLDGLTGAQRAA